MQNVTFPCWVFLIIILLLWQVVVLLLTVVVVVHDIMFVYQLSKMIINVFDSTITLSVFEECLC